MNTQRRKSRPLNLGGLSLGGEAPIRIQSMTTTPTREVEATAHQISRLVLAGCEIVRMAVRDATDAEAIAAVKARSHCPLVADIHFDPHLALLSLKAGADGIRINPGNLAHRDALPHIVALAEEKRAVIRVGVNLGSLRERRDDASVAADMDRCLDETLNSALELEGLGATQLKLSIKASSPEWTLTANRLLAERCDYPLHVGVTESGTLLSGAVRSTAALTPLLREGIGDTVRISLAADPVNEVRAARALLEALSLRQTGVRVIACPTCGRCANSDFFELAARIEQKLEMIRQPLTVAVMGCEVNGPGEASDADIGLAFSGSRAVLFVKGQKKNTVSVNDAEAVLLEGIHSLLEKPV